MKLTAEERGDLQCAAAATNESTRQLLARLQSLDLAAPTN
jgi:hypothetical protein